MTAEPELTREEFGVAVAALLTDEQRAEIGRLHERVGSWWSDGCAAHGESAKCCVDEIVEAVR